MKSTRIFLILLSLVAIASGLGCAALSEYVTPAAIDRRAVEYVTDAGIADPNVFAGYGNLDKANRLAAAVGDAHQVNQQALSQLLDKDSLEYSQLLDVTQNNRQIAAAREEMLFGETGLLALGATAAGFGTLTGLIGLARKRPGDITPQQLNEALDGTGAELSEKQNQFAELVTGIGNFLKSDFAKHGAGLNLKGALATAQSAATKKAVAVLKV